MRYGKSYSILLYRYKLFTSTVNSQVRPSSLLVLVSPHRVRHTQLTYFNSKLLICEKNDTNLHTHVCAIHFGVRPAENGAQRQRSRRSSNFWTCSMKIFYSATLFGYSSNFVTNTHLKLFIISCFSHIHIAFQVTPQKVIRLREVRWTRWSCRISQGKNEPPRRNTSVIDTLSPHVRSNPSCWKHFIYATYVCQLRSIFSNHPTLTFYSGGNCYAVFIIKEVKD